jgi:PKD repeat protein
MTSRITGRLAAHALFALFLAGAAPAALAQQISAQIKPSRTSGVAPLAVFFDAMEDRDDPQYPLTRHSDAAVDEFHDLLFQWDFGDSGSATWAVTGKSKNVATGPVAAHVFETAGTYTVRLTVRDANGVTGTASVNINVQSPDSAFSGKTTCVSRNGDFAGCPSGAVQLTDTRAFDVILDNEIDARGRRRVLFHRGQEWSIGSTYSPPAGPGLVGAFGSGAKPVVRQSSPIQYSLSLNDDWRMQDLHLVGVPGASGSRAMGFGSGTANGLYLRMSIEPGTFAMGVAQAISSGNANGLFVVDCDLRKLSSVGGGGNIGYVQGRRIVILGSVFDDSKGGEHVLRIPHADGLVISNSQLSRQAVNKAVLSLRSADVGGSCGFCGEWTQNVVISDNLIGGSASTTVGLVGSAGSSSASQGRDIIFERNYFYAAEPDGPSNSLGAASAVGLTIRNNIANLDGYATGTAFQGFSFSSMGNSLSNNARLQDVRFYNNTCHTKTSTSSPIKCVFWAEAIPNSQAKNNLFYAPGASNARLFTGSPPSGGAMAGNLMAVQNPFVVAQPASPTDYKLPTSSIAKDKGARINVLDDWSLAFRPTSAALDVGAWEQGSSFTAPTPTQPPPSTQPPPPPVLLEP